MTLYLKISFSIIICLVLGFLSGYFTSDAITDWYVYLNKPFFQPPNWLFAPVWTILYILMGISFALIWDSDKPAKIKSNAMIYFGIQFLLNLIWTPVFFGFKLLFPAFLIISILIIMLVVTIKKFKIINHKAAIMLIPYLLWVCFASILNLSIVILN